MDLNHALLYWTNHNASIIQWIAAFICGLSIILIFRIVVRKKDEDMRVPDLSNIESSLKKILESAGAKQFQSGDAAAASGAVAGGSGAVDPALVAEVQTLKEAVAAKDAELEKLKSAAPAAGGGDDGLAEKIKDLEAKLAEYQILEDDIADLTRYKKENEELKAQLAGGGAAAAAAAPTESAPTAAPTPPDASPVAEAAPTPEPAPVSAAELATPPEAAAKAEPASVAPGPDLVAEFQATVQEQKKAEGNDLLGEFSTEQKPS